MQASWQPPVTKAFYYSAMYVDILERLRQETKTGFSWAEVFGVSKNAKIQSNNTNVHTLNITLLDTNF